MTKDSAKLSSRRCRGPRRNGRGSGRPGEVDDVEVVIGAPVDWWCASPGGSDGWNRSTPGPPALVGSTSNPLWYAEQLAAVPASYRIVDAPAIQEVALLIGQRMLESAR